MVLYMGGGTQYSAQHMDDPVKGSNNQLPAHHPRYLGCKTVMFEHYSFKAPESIAEFFNVQYCLRNAGPFEKS